MVLGRLARGRRREQHGLVVEVRRDGTGGLTGQEAGLELDRALAELAVVENGLDGGDDGLAAWKQDPAFSSRSDAQRNNVGVVDVAGDGHDHVAGRVVAPVEAVDLRARHRRDRRLGAGDRPAERGVAPRLVGEQVVHDVVGVVVVHRDLVEDHVALGLDVGLGDGRGGHHVAEHVDRGAEVLVEDPGVEDGVLLGGEGVELAAHRVERDRDLHRGALGGALEEQVLEEVRAAVQGRGLVARPDVDPHADAGRAGAGHLLGDDPQAAGQDRTTYARGHRSRRRP